jgi:hypothetical protein
MLLDGELDAVLGEKVDHPDLKPLFADSRRKRRRGRPNTVSRRSITWRW